MDGLKQFLSDTFRALDAGVIDKAGAASRIGQRLCDEVSCDRASIVTLEDARVIRLGGFDAVVGAPLTPDVELSSKSQTAHHVADRRMGMYPPIGEDSDGWPQALRELYLMPNGLQSLTVAAIGSNPNVTGFVCAASLAPREWSIAEMAKLRLIANAIALRRARLDRDGESRAVLWPGREA